jgi:hypothetical protein
VIIDHPSRSPLAKLKLVDDRSRIAAHRRRQRPGYSVEIERPTAPIEQQSAHEGGRAHHGSARRDDTRSAGRVVAGLSERWEPFKRHSYRSGPPRPRPPWTGRHSSPNSDEEHPSPSLGYAVIRRVEDHHLGVEAELACGTHEQRLTDGLPSRTLREIRDILHHEGGRADRLHHVEEAMHVLASRVLWIHATDPRPALAGRPADDHVKIVAGDPDGEQIPRNDVRPEVMGVRPAGMPVALVRPGELKTRLSEAEIQAPRTRVQREDAWTDLRHASIMPDRLDRRTDVPACGTRTASSG